ncbi:MAG: peptidoglycan-binding domain-containing protein, partial [Roseovarius indicus]
GYQALSFNEKKELQRQLKNRGLGIEKIDGLIGPNTRSAIVAFQRSAGMKADGNPSQEVLRRLKGS